MFSLKNNNTFALNAFSKKILFFYSVKQMYNYWKIEKSKNQPILFLGDGSNVLFLKNYYGTILVNRIYGYKVFEKKYLWKIYVRSGEIWKNLVRKCIDQNIPGLENLALIPGRVGGAPIQNIGAYGVEFKDFCEYVDVFNLKKERVERIYRENCKFEYRSSIFSNFFSEYVVIAVGLIIKKKWNPRINHKSILYLKNQNITPKKIYKEICKIRKKKFPNINIFGNAGSFFKNPIVSFEKSKNIIQKYPDIPYKFSFYKKKYKFFAGWMIEKCGLKGYKYLGAKIWDKQALILLNTGKATGRSILKLSRIVQKKVKNKFGVFLLPEVHLISKFGRIKWN
ncbi:UDP-N-acetylmuramate dehydrogenase [bacterium endosymbiont of Pedicinus badii]|uniref:UDP-N-acetylmuramate dehydrogenase n=1 Tax=bacterium endosymbiont of Pedicinus badii TaxID=1719126 RepID=UPI0009BA45F2|nr:UDP-N-acetylmuramate dehydrogenase [bacterium endosymbiont of Pedicinus badii]OQM34130.1 hypothetical protein AOQ89_02185 [bacterium endosymbiont of Pedicinus badii]